MKAAIEAEPEADYLYSDEDKVDEQGKKYDPFRKPPWSPERLRGQMYTSHLSVLRTALVREVGGFHEGFDGSQDHDLVLRVTERARKVVHVPQVLYHWRAIPGSAAQDPEAKPYAWTAGQRAVQAHVDRVGINATVELGPVPGTYHLDRHLDPRTRVSVVIPTRGGEGLVWGSDASSSSTRSARSSSAAGTTTSTWWWSTTPTPPSPSSTSCARWPAASSTSCPTPKPFNFSEKCNLGVVASYGEIVVLLNDDIEIELGELHRPARAGRCSTTGSA